MNRKKVLIYIICFTISIVVFFIGILSFNRNFFDSFFYAHCADRFMDFFNSIRDAKDSHVYDVEGVIYPPLINCVFFLISLIIPKKYVNLSFADRYLMQNSWWCIFLYTLYILLHLLLLLWILFKGFKNKKIAFVFWISFIFSIPFFWAFERGNVIICAIIYLIGFVLLKNNEDLKIRQISYLFMAISAAIKIYPCIFTLLLLKDKQYKEFFKCWIYILALVMLPFVFYGGFNGMIYMFKSILSFNSNHSSSTEIYATGIIFFFARYGITVPTIVSYIYVLFLLIMAFFVKKEWARSFLITLVILNMAGSQIKYNSIYLFITISLLLQMEEEKWIDLLSLAALCCMVFLNPFKISLLNQKVCLLWEYQIFPLIIFVIGLIVGEVNYDCFNKKINLKRYLY